MHKIRLSVVLIAAMAAGAGAADAQSLRNADEPAEFPPDSYTGRQYVDSRGCVYIRAGFDGAVTWVPRVDRGRNVVCGFQPTLTGPRTLPTVADAPATTPAPVPRTVMAAPAPTPAPAPVVTAPPPVATANTTIQIVPRAGTSATTSVCPGVSGVSAAYMQPTNGFPVRCGPQAESPYGRAPGSSSLEELTPPPGYRAVDFGDDRLNPNRGVQTLDGWTQMSLVWTQTVPRRLIDVSTGQDVTAKYPTLQYPFTTLQQQRVAAETGEPVKLVLPNGDVARAVVVSGPAPAVTETRISTKSAEPESAAPASSPFVQAGRYTDDAAARAAVLRLQQAGLPVKIGKGTSNGKPFQIVVAGPYATEAALQAGLRAVRALGFTDARPRD